jgi:hypothetical protein
VLAHYSFTKLEGKEPKLAARYSLFALGIAGVAYLISKKPHRQEAVTTYSFMMDTIEQKKDRITLAWPGTGGSYRVFRDHQLIYSGLEPSVTDQQLTPGTTYTYTIERVDEQDHVLDRIKVQTATAVEEKRGENILLDLVLTTIVAKGQISLAWEPIDGIKEYTIFRNGVDIGKVDRCSFIDQNISDDKEYNYTIKAKRPLQRSEQENSEVKSLLASLVGVIKKDSSKEQAAMEEFSITKRIGPVKQLLQPVKEQPNNAKKSWKFRYTTFLTKKWLKNPNAVSKVYYFTGDNRGFDSDSSRYRTRVDVFIHDKDKAPSVELSKEVGKTEAYSSNRKFIKEGRASDEGIKLGKVVTTDDKTTFQLIHSVGNPMIVSPAIDYVLNGTFYRNGVIDIVGIHDQAPHHEAYLKETDDSNWQTIHQAKSKGLEMMAHQMANHLWRFSTFTQ